MECSPNLVNEGVDSNSGTTQGLRKNSKSRNRAVNTGRESHLLARQRLPDCNASILGERNSASSGIKTDCGLPAAKRTLASDLQGQHLHRRKGIPRPDDGAALAFGGIFPGNLPDMRF